MIWLLWVGLTLSLLVFTAMGLCAYGSSHWTATTQALMNRLEAGRHDETIRPSKPATFDSRELEGLPAPVQRYFRTVLKEGQPIIAAVTIELSGYQVRDEMTVPSASEAAWLRPEGHKPYFRGTVTSLIYEFLA